MEFIRKTYTIGQIREQRSFLIFPKTIRYDGREITKWLQVATWQEEYQATRRLDRWVPTKFID